MLRCKRWDPWCTMNIYELRNYVSCTPARSGPISLICVLDLFFSQLIVFSPWWICELNYRSGVYKTPTVTPQRWRLLGEFDKKLCMSHKSAFQWGYLQGPSILNLLFNHVPSYIIIHCHLPFPKVICCECSGRTEAKDHVKCVGFCGAIDLALAQHSKLQKNKGYEDMKYIEIQNW